MPMLQKLAHLRMKRCRGALCASANAIQVKQASGRPMAAHTLNFPMPMPMLQKLAHLRMKRCRGALCASANAIQSNKLPDGQWLPIHQVFFIPDNSFRISAQSVKLNLYICIPVAQYLVFPRGNANRSFKLFIKAGHVKIADMLNNVLN